MNPVRIVVDMSTGKESRIPISDQEYSDLKRDQAIARQKAIDNQLKQTETIELQCLRDDILNHLAAGDPIDPTQQARFKALRLKYPEVPFSPHTHTVIGPDGAHEVECIGHAHDDKGNVIPK